MSDFYGFWHVGHEGDKVGMDPGAVDGKYKECNYALLIAKYCKQYLVENYKEVHITMSRTGDKFGKSWEYAKQVNKSGKFDVVVSFHMNAFNGKAYGAETLCYSKDGKEYDLAKAVQNRLTQVGFKDRGVKVTPDIAILSQTDPIAVLAECGFVDSKTDRKLWGSKKKCKKIGIAIAKGIAGYFKLTKKDEYKALRDLKIRQGAGVKYKSVDKVKKGAVVKCKGYSSNKRWIQTSSKSWVCIKTKVGKATMKKI